MTIGSDVLSHARDAYKYGFSLIPLKEGSKLPNLQKGHEFLRRKPTKEEYKAFKFGNYGIVCGALSGICVLDVDYPEGFDTLQELDIDPETYAAPVVATPGGGKHYYFKYNPNVRTGVAVVGRGVDIRSDGSYVVGPGSVVGDGTYTWRLSPEEVDLDEPPLWMHKHTGEGYHSSQQDVWMDEPIGNGKRNMTIASLAGSLVARDMPASLILDVCQYINNKWVKPPLEYDEVEKTVLSMERYRNQKP